MVGEFSKSCQSLKEYFYNWLFRSLPSSRVLNIKYDEKSIKRIHISSKQEYLYYDDNVK